MANSPFELTRDSSFAQRQQGLGCRWIFRAGVLTRILTMFSPCRMQAILAALALSAVSVNLTDAGQNGAQAPAPKSTRGDAYGDPLPAAAIARLGTTRFRNGVSVPFVAFLLGDSAVLSVGTDAVIRLWDPGSGKQLRSLTIDTRPRALGHLMAGSKPIAVSQDRKLLLSSTGAGQLSLWDLASGKRVREFEQVELICSAVAFGPDAKTVMQAGESVGNGGMESVIQSWDLQTGRKLHSLSLQHAYLSAAAISPDGQTMALVGMRDRDVELWDTTKGEKIHSLRQQSFGIRDSLCFDPTGKILATANTGFLSVGKEIRKLMPLFVRGAPFARRTSDDDVMVTPWDVATGKRIRELQGKGGVGGMVFSRDGKTLATAGPRDGVRLWEVDSGKIIFETGQAHPQAISVALSTDSKKVACGTLDSSIRVWDIAAQKEISQPSNQGPVQALALAPDGSAIATASNDGMTRLWALPSGTRLWHSPDDSPSSNSTSSALEPSTRGASALVFSTDGSELIGAGRKLRTWATSGGKERRRQALTERSVGETQSVLSADGRTVATLIDTRVEVRDAVKNVLRSLMDFKGGAVHDIALSCDGRLLAVASSPLQNGVLMPAGRLIVALVDGKRQRNQETRSRGSDKSVSGPIRVQNRLFTGRPRVGSHALERHPALGRCLGHGDPPISGKRGNDDPVCRIFSRRQDAGRQ
jgi:WD40 repeat protein